MKQLLCVSLSLMLAVMSPVTILAGVVPSKEELENRNLGYRHLDECGITDRLESDTDDTPPFELYGETSDISYYSSFDEGYVPSFRDQGVHNLCWAVSALSAVEINMIKKGLAERDSVNLSEGHLAYYFYAMSETAGDPLGNEVGDYARPISGDWISTGGNSALTMWELASGIGPVSENVKEEYRYENITSSLVFDNTTDDIFKNNAVRVNNIYRENISDRASVKDLIASCGSVVVGYYSSASYDSFYQGKTPVSSNDVGSYYCPDENYANHSIAIIGWNDAYSKENFSQTPSSDGAWLVLNSFGEEDEAYAQKGLFWLSYEDVTLEDTVYAFDCVAADTYDNAYQYDGAEGIYTITGDRFANVFEAEGENVLEAVSIGVLQPGVDYEARVYAVTDENGAGYPDSVIAGLLNGTYEGTDYTMREIAGTSGTFEYSGYHTVEFEKSDKEDRAVHDGELMMVVFSFPQNIEVYMDKTYEESGFVSFVTGVDAYDGYIGADGRDMTSYSGGTFRIKAFTDSAVEVPVVEIPESERELTLNVGDSYTLSYETRNNPENLPVSFKSSNGDIASVSSDGVITAKKRGSTVISAGIGEGGPCVEISVTVNAPIVDFSIMESRVDIPIGTEKVLTVNIAPSDTTDDTEVVWSVDTNEYVTVTQDGIIRAVKSGGPAVVTASVLGGKFKDSCEVYVTAETDLEGIFLEKENVFLEKGKEAALSYRLFGETDEAVSWSSSDASVVSVDGGVVTGVSYGSAAVTVSVNGFSDSCMVYVDELVINAETDAVSELLVGDTVQLQAGYSFLLKEAAGVTWYSGNEEVVVVDSSGRVTAVGAGRAAVYAETVDGMLAEYVMEVSERQQSAEIDIILTCDKTTLAVGETSAISVEYLSSVSLNDVCVVFAGDDCVSVSSNGIVTGMREGTGAVTVTVSANGVSASDTVQFTVLGEKNEEENKDQPGESPKVPSVSFGDFSSEEESEKVPYIRKILLFGMSHNIAAGKKLRLNAVVLPAEADGAKLVWKSSNTRYATVNQDGVVHTKKKGAGKTVIISCRSADGSGAVASFSVNIKRNRVTSVKIKQKQNKRSIKAGKSLKLSAVIKVSGKKDVNKKVKWSSSNEKYAKVSSNGKVRTYKAGKGKVVTITCMATDGTGKKADYKIRIK